MGFLIAIIGVVLIIGVIVAVISIVAGIILTMVVAGIAAITGYALILGLTDNTTLALAGAGTAVILVTLMFIYMGNQEQKSK